MIYIKADSLSTFKKYRFASFMSFVEDLPAKDFIVMVGPGEQSDDKKTLNELWSSLGVKNNV